MHFAQALGLKLSDQTKRRFPSKADKGGKDEGKHKGKGDMLERHFPAWKTIVAVQFQGSYHGLPGMGERDPVKGGSFALARLSGCRAAAGGRPFEKLTLERYLKHGVGAAIAGAEAEKEAKMKANTAKEAAKEGTQEEVESAPKGRSNAESDWAIRLTGTENSYSPLISCRNLDVNDMCQSQP